MLEYEPKFGSFRTTCQVRVGRNNDVDVEHSGNLGRWLTRRERASCRCVSLAAFCKPPLVLSLSLSLRSSPSSLVHCSRFPSSAHHQPSRFYFRCASVKRLATSRGSRNAGRRTHTHTKKNPERSRSAIVGRRHPVRLIH